MDLDQMNGRFQRLKDELAHAYAQEPWPTGRIDRLIEEISATELAIAAIAPEVPRTTTRTPSVARNRLTPFGAPAPHPAGE